MNKILKITNQKILVTGGAGFIGGALISWLLKNTQATIINLDKLGYASDLSRINQDIELLNVSSNRYKFVLADLIDNEKIIDLVNDFQPDIVFHLAAESHVDRSIASPRNFLDSNVIGTFNLLDALKNYWLNLAIERKNSFRFLHISTDEVYGSLGSKGYFDERTPYNPTSPYSASKAASDHFVKAFYYTYGIPILITNCSNNYGPWQYPEKLIPVIISNALSNQPIPIYGDGSNIRDWIYVDDHVEGLIFVFEYGLIGNSYCIGSSEEHNNLEIANKVCRGLDVIRPNLQPYENLIKSVNDRLGHDQRYAINSKKIKEKLGWKPRYKFNDALQNTVKWYVNNQDWCNRVSMKKKLI